MNASPPPLPPLHGLVLSGGFSRRMGSDKALLDNGGVPQLSSTFALLSAQVPWSFVSLRPEQRQEPVRAALPGIVDGLHGIGPAAGLLAAHARFPEAAWLVLACDLPSLRTATLERVISARREPVSAIAYAAESDGLPEPLCALWEPAALQALASRVAAGHNGLRACLLSLGDALCLLPPAAGELANANTPEERDLSIGAGQ